MRYVAETASVGEDCRLGKYVVIEEGARIGRGCVLGHHVVIHAGSLIGDGVRIDDHAVIGKQPMRAANTAVTRDGEQPPAEIGEGFHSEDQTYYIRLRPNPGDQ